jgi:AcrR family transcriptional regulator
MSVSAPRRTASRLRPEARTAEIMRAAREVFREKGYEDATTSEIAERAGVVEGTLYRYFESKRDLLVKVVEVWYHELLSDFDAQLKGVRGTWNRLRFMVWKHLSAIEQEPALCRLVFEELRAGAEYRGTAVFDLNREYTRRTVDILREGVEAGELREDVPLTLVRDMIFGSIEHQTFAYLRNRGSLTPDKTADAITNVLFNGLRRERVAGAGEDRLAAAAERLERAAERLERGAGAERETS